MKVTLNTAINNNLYNRVSFGKAKEASNAHKEYSEKEIRVAKTKKAISECATVAVGVGILYFAMKHNFKVNAVKDVEKKAKEIASFKAPEIKIKPDTAGVSNFIGV